jgi:hypothetical protein
MSDVHYICCPFIDCCNEKKTQDIEEIREHLLVRGFMRDIPVGRSTVNIRRLCMRTQMWVVMMM